MTNKTNNDMNDVYSIFTWAFIALVVIMFAAFMIKDIEVNEDTGDSAALIITDLEETEAVLYIPANDQNVAI